MTDLIKFASCGDTIECDVQHPWPQTLRVRIDTPEACAFANELIAAGRWRVAVPAEAESPNA